MIVTIDIGNSRIKSALWHEGVIIGRAAIEHSPGDKMYVVGELFSRLQASSREKFTYRDLTCIYAVCVSGDELRQPVVAWIKQHWHKDVQFLVTEKRYHDVVNGYQIPSQHGADRWACVVAAHEIFPDTSVCIIGAGTALTFDLLGKDGVHLGGYILPSCASMHAVLLSHTQSVESRYDDHFKLHGVPDNTDDAVNQGLHRLLRAGICDICKHAEHELGGPMQVIITGGGAKTVLAYPEIPAMQHEPDLVMQGLYEIMKSRNTLSDS